MVENSDEFGYVVKITTPQFLFTMMEKKNSFLLPDYPFLVASKLTDDIIKAAIESFINPPGNDKQLSLDFFFSSTDTCLSFLLDFSFPLVYYDKTV